MKEDIKILNCEVNKVLKDSMGIKEHDMPGGIAVSVVCEDEKQRIVFVKDGDYEIIRKKL